MKTLLLSAGFAVAASAALAETEIRVHYAIPTIWADTQEALAEAFMVSHPDIKVTIDGPAEGYADGVQRLLREAVASTAPDVAFVGLNRWRILEDRGLTQPLDAFLPEDPGAQATPRRFCRWASTRVCSTRLAPRPRPWCCT